MAYKKYNSANNAFATLAFPIDDTDMTCVLQGKYSRMPTSNFIMKVTHTASGVVTGRENIYVTTRTGANCTGLVRAYEPVPTDDDATTNIQQALNFDAGDLCECVISAEVIKDMQDNLASQVGIQNQSYSYVADTGSANAYVITLSPAITAYVAGQKFSFKVSNSNSGTSTLNVNGLGVKTIKKTGGTANLASGDIVAGQIVEVVYDGTDFEMQTPVPVTIPTDSFILGEGCAAGDAIAIEQIPYPLAATTQVSFGNATATQFQGFRLIGNGVAMTTISLVLKKILAPADNCIIAIQADSAGSPSGSDLATATIAGGTITTSLAEYNPTLSGSITPADGAYYWVICRRSGALDAANYYQIGINAEATVAFGYKTNNAGAWGSLIQTNSFPISGLGFYSEVAVRAKATLQKFSTIRLYSPSALSVFGRVSKSISDIYSGLASLKQGMTYFLSNTAGAISLTQGTVKSYAGEAKSASSIRLSKRIVGHTKITTSDSNGTNTLTPGTTQFTNKGGLLVLRATLNGNFPVYSRFEYSVDTITWSILGELTTGSANSGTYAGSVTAMIEPGFYRVQHQNGGSYTVTSYLDMYEYDIL